MTISSLFMLELGIGESGLEITLGEFWDAAVMTNSFDISGSLTSFTNEIPKNRNVCVFSRERVMEQGKKEIKKQGKQKTNKKKDDRS